MKHQRKKLGLGLSQLPWTTLAISSRDGMVAWLDAVASLDCGEDRRRRSSVFGVVGEDGGGSCIWSWLWWICSYVWVLFLCFFLCGFRGSTMGDWFATICSIILFEILVLWAVFGGQYTPLFWLWFFLLFLFIKIFYIYFIDEKSEN